jgi:thiol:disulfide interchange protein DsbG
MRKILTGTMLLCAFFSLSFIVPTASAADNNGHMAAVAKEMMAGIHKATWIEEGKSAHVIYVFFDPNCPYCHRIYVNTRDLVKQNAIQIRWVPGGVLTATSYGKALALLDATDPLKAFYHDENNFSGEDGGAVDEALDGTDSTKKALKENAKLLRLTGFDAVPSILFLTNEGQPYLIQGSPPADKLKAILKYVQ